MGRQLCYDIESEKDVEIKFILETQVVFLPSSSFLM